MENYKTEGIVLHTIRYGDSSLVAYIYTERFGRRTYMIPGAKSKKGKGNKTALLQPLFPVSIEGVSSARTQMDRIKELHISQPLLTIPFDVRRSTVALFIAEVLYRLVREEESNPDLFTFVRNSITALDAMEEGVANFHLWFMVRLSSFLGFYPSDDYVPGSYFDFMEGRFTMAMPEHRNVIGFANSELLGRLMECPVGKLCQLEISRRQRSEFLEALLHYFEFHLDAVGKIQSVKILKEVF